MIAIDQDRLDRITSLYRGPHVPNDTHMCAMEAVAWVTHSEWSDAPPCVCPVIAAFLRTWNDGLQSDEDRVRLLKPLIPHVVNTKGSAALEQRRGAMAADWLIRVQTPAWLRLAGLNKHADALADLPEITDFAQPPSLEATLKSIRADAVAAWVAAWDDVAEAAAKAAARIAASAAVRVGAACTAVRGIDACADAETACVIARDAAGAIFRGIDACADAETACVVQQSALALLHRMIALKTS